jgi:hypothetical protein
MRTSDKCINPPSSTSPEPPEPPGSTPPNAFSPVYLEQVRGQDDTLTASEAAVAGPWKVVRGRQGRVAVLRAWESLAAGDRPEAEFVHEEHARMFAAMLPLTGREPLFHLDLVESAEPEGFALEAVFGEQGPCTVGWLRRAEPALVEALHFAEGLVRCPAALAALLQVAGGALEQVGRILVSRDDERPEDEE